jgi:CDP-diacylglycerol--glycerol-3-phosphate 3-phosphatidyltransferase
VNSTHRGTRPNTELHAGTSGEREPFGLHGWVEFKSKVKPRLTISNVLSLSRVLLLFPIISLIFKTGTGSRLPVLSLMLIAAATDFLDGALARALKQVTDFGKLLDPVADKICIVGAVISLVIVGDVPLWYAIIVVFRDLLIVIGSLLIISRRRIVVQSMWAGKFTVTFVAAYLILATMRIESLILIKTFMLYLSTLSIFLSLAVYYGVFQREMKDVNYER